MLIISKYLLGTKSIESFTTRESHKILNVRLENEVSDPEIYVLEDTSTPEITKHLLIIEDNLQLDNKIDNLNYINSFELRKGLHKFFVFELLNGYNFKKEDISTRTEFKQSKSTINFTETNLDIYKKYARVPKPDLDKIYSKEELVELHPIKQLKYLLINKYNIKNRICNKLSVDKQLEFILISQEGNKVDPLSLIKIDKPKLNIITIKNSNCDSAKVLSQSPYDPQLKFF
jgi:hypothetical protein